MVPHFDYCVFSWYSAPCCSIRVTVSTTDRGDDRFVHTVHLQVINYRRDSVIHVIGFLNRY